MGILDKDKIGIIETEFKIYKDGLGSKFQAYINQKISEEPLKSFLTDLFDIYLFSSFLLDSKKIILNENERALGFIYMRSSIIVYGIVKLFENGIYSEVFTLNRSLMELYLTAKILVEKDFDRRSILYLEFNWVKRYKKLENDPDLFPKEIKKEIEAKYECIKNNYSSAKYQKGFDWTWEFYEKIDKKGTSIYSMFERQGITDEYRKYFNNYSEFVHPSPLFFNIFRNNEGRFNCGPNYSDWIYNTGITTVYFFNQILNEIIDYLRIDKSESFILLLFRKFRSFTLKYKK